MQEQGITPGKTQLAPFAAEGDLFSCGGGKNPKTLQLKPEVFLSKGITKWIILSLFPCKSLSVLLPGQGHINSSEQGHHCLFCYRAMLPAFLGGLVPGCSSFLPLLQCSVMMLLVAAYLTCSLITSDPSSSLQFFLSVQF